MADFRAMWNAGTIIAPWEDPELGTRPSRLNPRVEHGHRRAVGNVGVELEAAAFVAGTLGPLDSELDGELFSAFLAESPTMPPPAVTGAHVRSSVQRFTPPVPGHYTLRMVREGHGSIFLHVDVD
jgi:hypothetical protein